jgi:DNA invertase Pin-like site-specific DNA recombinase
MQLSAIRAYAKRRGWSVTAEVREVGSGAKTRPQREEILKSARLRELDATVVWLLDRWGRSLLDLIGSLHSFIPPTIARVSAMLCATSGKAGRVRFSATLMSQHLRSQLQNLETIREQREY